MLTESGLPPSSSCVLCRGVLCRGVLCRGVLCRGVPSRGALSHPALAGAVLAVLALAACSAPGGDESTEPELYLGRSPQAIVGAQTDTEHTAVLAVAAELGHGEALCTGTLIAPNLVLTAQHCIAATANATVDCQTSGFAKQYAVGDVWVSPDTRLNNNADFYPAREIHVPPDSEDLCGNDIALIILNGQFTSSIVPMSPRLDASVGAGEVYTAIGFGDALTEGDPGVRRAREGLKVTCGTAQCSAGDSLSATEFLGAAAVCEGDSGGPALDADELILGVVSRGEDNCGRTIYSAVAPWGDWIREVGTHAAELGNYATPDWLASSAPAGPGIASGTPGDVAGGDFEGGDASGVAATPKSSGSGCAVSTHGVSAAPSNWLALLGLAAGAFGLRARRPSRTLG